MWRAWLAALASASLLLVSLANAQVRHAAPMGFHGGFGPSRGRVFTSGGFGFRHNPRVNGFFGNPLFIGNRFFFGNPFFFRRGFVQPFPFVASVIAPLSADTSPAYPPMMVERYDTGNIAYEQQLADALNRLSEQIARLREEREENTRRDQDRSSEQKNESVQRESASRPTVLVFHDGHRLEVNDYAIVGHSFWILSETHAQRVPLADLDLKATADLNAERGVPFNIPTQPPPPPK